jgi:zinc transporter 5/7
MASSYALPASAMTHSHHGHLHSHSHSPGRQHSANTTRSLRQERSNGSLHSHTVSESHLDHDHGHNHGRESSPYLPSYTTILEKPLLQDSPDISQLASYKPSLNAVNVLPHDHGHTEHLHNHTPVIQPRSRFTSAILPYVLAWPLLHTIMADKDSRRIFYFMRFARSLFVVSREY